MFGFNLYPSRKWASIFFIKIMFSFQVLIHDRYYCRYFISHYGAIQVLRNAVGGGGGAGAGRGRGGGGGVSALPEKSVTKV